MKTINISLIAFMAAVMTSALVAVVISQSLLSGLFVAGFGAVYGAIIGVPLFIVFYKLKMVKWWLSMIAGFLAASLFDIVSIMNYWSYMQANGYLESMIEKVVRIGLLGSLGGITFWWVWGLLSRHGESLQAKPKSGSPEL